MKKILLLSITLFTIQFTNAQIVTYGVKAGINLANLSYSGGNSDNLNPKSLTGFHFGLLGVTKLKENLSFQLEVLYSQQGSKQSTSTGNPLLLIEKNETITLNYINVPIIFKYYLIPELSVEAGPQVGFLLDGKEDSQISTSVFGVVSTVNSSIDLKKEIYKTVDFGFNLGASVYFARHFSIGGRYNFGLNNLYDKSDRGNFSIKNNVISISAGYKF
jgi:hypothetical protein